MNKSSCTDLEENVSILLVHGLGINILCLRLDC